MMIVDEGKLGGGKLDEQAAAEHIHGICLKTGPPRRVGIEIEWLVRDARNPAIGVSAERITDAMSGFAAAPGLPTSSSPGVLPSGAPLTTEPGGQLELSSLPADSLADCVRATVDDLAALRAAADGAGLELAGFGLDPLRPPRRVLELPRYAAMEAFFDRGGPWGRQMMCTTAAVQVSLDAGDGVICLRAHCFIHHHLQHQVDAALEVKTKVDTVGQRRLPGRRAYALRNAEDAKDEHEKHCNDQEGFTHGSRNQVFRRAYRLPAKYGYLASSWLVVTEAIALLMTSILTPSGGTRSCTASSLIEMMVPRIPPVVVMRSPDFRAPSISCHCFCFFWLGRTSIK